MNIKDYLHLYGLKAKVFFDNKIWEVNRIGTKYIQLKRKTTDGWQQCSIYYEDAKLILRPLSDTTEDERKALPKHIDNEISLFEGGRNAWRININSEAILYLLSKHFDLFSLIEAGLAIDKTTIKNQTT